MDHQKNIIKHVTYKLNSQKYFDIDTEMDTETWHIAEP